MKKLLAIGCILAMLGLSLWTAGQDAQPAKERLPVALGAIHPRISPDGSTIVCSYQGAIWTLPQGGGTMTRLTEGEGFDQEPAWSPDGNVIAFVRGGELRLITAKDGRAVASPKGVQVRGPFNFQKLEFHPDGSRILGVFFSEGKNHGLAWLDLKTGAVKSVLAPLSSWARYGLSADGQTIAFSTNRNKPDQQAGNDGPQADLWKMPAEGGTPEKIVRFPAHIHDICWSAAGKSLIVTGDAGGAYYDLWHIPLANPLAGMKKWTFGQADEDRPSTSRDGKWLVYTDNRHGPTALVVRDLGTGLERTVVIDRLDYRRPTGTLRLAIRDAKSPAIARIVLQEEKGKFHAPPGALYRIHQGASHFYCDGAAQWTLPAGKYRLRAFRGPECTPQTHELVVQPGQTLDLTVELKRWTHPARDGWFSGENHIHANYGYGQWYNTPQTMLEQCGGEDLNVCNFMVANSDTDNVYDRAFFRGGPDPLSRPETILYWNQEFRSTLWGHMTLVNLKQVVEPVFTGFLDTTNPWDVPTNGDVAERTHWQKGLVNYTHPFGNAAKPFENPYAAKGLPIDVALGKIDTLDLNNAYAGTVPIWHRLLNCGFRLPPSAGTDCFLNRIQSRLPGSDRVYVHTGGALTYERWIDGLRAGRSFVSNGPILKLAIAGQTPGGTIKMDGRARLKVAAAAMSQYPMAKVELLHNGQVAAALSLGKDGLSATLDQEIAVDHGGWLALCATGPGHPDSAPLFAHAAPIYIEMKGKPHRSRDDALYFLAWIDDLNVIVRGRDRVPTEERRRHIQAQLDAARAVYARIAKEGQ